MVLVREYVNEENWYRLGKREKKKKGWGEYGCEREGRREREEEDPCLLCSTTTESKILNSDFDVT